MWRVAWWRFWGRRRWPRFDGKLVDRRRVKELNVHVESGYRRYFIDEYMLEITEADGSTSLVLVREDHHDVPDLNHMEIGRTFGVHVNRKRTRGAFAAVGTTKAQRREQRDRDEAEKKADEARFKARLEDQ